MKIKLLTLTICTFFSLALLTTVKVNAQIRAYEHFEYPIGTDYYGVNGSGIGWGGPWDVTKVGPDTSVSKNTNFHLAIEGNLEGSIGATGTHGDTWSFAYRDLETPFLNLPSNEVWIAFTHKYNNPGNFSGAAFFSGDSEVLFLGRFFHNSMGIPDCYPDSACLGILDNSIVEVLNSDTAHYYLAKITGLGNDIIKVDLWIDYEGSNEPVANYDQESTYIAGGYKKNTPGIDKIRINGYSESWDASTRYSSFDAIRFRSTFFKRNDYTLSNDNPLQLNSLNAVAT